MEDNKELEKVNKKSNNGGKRPGAGRKKGSLSKKTLEQKIVEEELKQRVLQSADSLLDAQLSLAQGCSYLYKIAKDTKGKEKKSELITNKHTIQEYLAGTLKNDGNYYYITTEKPSGYAIDSLLDRTFGKSTQKIEATGKDGNPMEFKMIFED